MKYYLKYDIKKIFEKILEDQLKSIDVPYKINGLGEIEFEKPIDIKKMQQVSTLLSIYGIEIINDHKTEIVQRIKECINEVISDNSILKDKNLSDFLVEKLNYSYTYLSSIFSENTYNSIENFVILKKIDATKHMLISGKFTLTEIAFELDYSSVAHLSRQFKKATGLTPTVFQKIVKNRNKKPNH